jgi:arylsulfatase A-like enzyme
VFDTTLRTDDLLNRLIAFLDEKVGRKNYTIVISADHGICPIPEVSKNKGVDAGRVNTDLLGKELENELAAKFGKSGSKGKYVESFTNGFVYFNKAVLSEKSIKLDDIIDFSKGWVKKQKGIADAFAVNDFANSKQSESSLLTQIALSYHPDRCGDLYVLLKPYYVPGNYLTGTTHGSPHKYDTHVPLVVFGGGVKPGLYKEKVAPTLAAAILAKFLEIPNPEKCQLEVPSFIWK